MNSFLRSANTAFKSAKELEKNLASVGITKDKFLGKKDHAQSGQSGAPTDTPGNVPSNQVQQPQQSNLEGAPTHNHGAPSDTSGAGVSTYSQQQYQNQAGPQGNIYAPPKDGLTAYNYNQEPHYYQNTGVPSTNYPPTIASVPQQNAHGQVPQQQSYKPGQPESTSFPTSNQYTAHPGQHYDPHAQSALSNNNHGTPPSNNFNIAAPNQPGQYAPPPGVYNQPNVVGSPPTSPDISGVPPNIRQSYEARKPEFEALLAGLKEIAWAAALDAAANHAQADHQVAKTASPDYVLDALTRLQEHVKNFEKQHS